MRVELNDRDIMDAVINDKTEELKEKFVSNCRARADFEICDQVRHYENIDKNRLLFFEDYVWENRDKIFRNLLKYGLNEFIYDNHILEYITKNAKYKLSHRQTVYRKNPRIEYYLYLVPDMIRIEKQWVGPVSVKFHNNYGRDYNIEIEPNDEERCVYVNLRDIGCDQLPFFIRAFENTMSERNWDSKEG